MEQAEREQLARTMYGAGESVRAVAEATGLSPYLAGKLKPGAGKKAKKSASKKKPPEPEEEQDIPADYQVTLTVPTARLDTLVAAEKLPPADLIKIDVQGAELDVIAGAKTALSRCEALIIELSLASYNKDAPLIGETLPAITQLGFRCVDICELHRAPAGNVLQADFLFVKPALFAAIGQASGLGGGLAELEIFS